MTITAVGVGATPNDGSGDTVRAAFVKINESISDLDDRSRGVGASASAPADALYVDDGGNVGIGTLTPPGRVGVFGIENKTTAINIDLNDFGDTATLYGVLIDIDTADFAPSANVSHYGERVTLTSSAAVTPTDANGDRLYQYGYRSDVSAGSGFYSYGGYFYAFNTGSDTTQAGYLIGSYDIANTVSSDATGGGAYVIGTWSRGLGNHTAGTAGAIYGLRAEAEQSGAGGTITLASAVYAEIDHNAGTMTTAYQFRGITSGTPATSWGLYSSGADKHYFEAAAAAGKGFEVEASDASFTGDALEVSATATGTGFDLITASANAGADVVFRVRGDGQVSSDGGAFVSGGADYAELFEWADGNPDGEDRVGRSVALDDGGKIRLAAAGDRVLGVISANPVILGDAAEHGWTGRYIQDDFGRDLWEPYSIIQWSELVETGEMIAADPEDPQAKDRPKMRRAVRQYHADKVPAGVTPAKDAQICTVDAEGGPLRRRRVNPLWDPARPYKPRADRPEWDAVGLLGKLRIRDGEVIPAHWPKLREVAPGVAEYLIAPGGGDAG